MAPHLREKGPPFIEPPLKKEEKTKKVLSFLLRSILVEGCHLFRERKKERKKERRNINLLNEQSFA